MAGAAALAMLASATAGAQTVAGAVAHANDNTRPAGVVENGVLTVSLVAGEGLWQPEGPSSPKLRLAAFAEEGRNLEVPGPLLRVSEGTRVSVRVKNSCCDAVRC